MNCNVCKCKTCKYNNGCEYPAYYNCGHYVPNKENNKKTNGEALENQKTGHWIMQGLSPYEGYIRCSECGAVYDIKRVFKYCPNCGAKMEDKKDESSD